MTEDERQPVTHGSDETAVPRWQDERWHDGVSIQRWRLKNFKSVRAADVELSPLTLLVGANSAGKSSLLQSILAVSQAAHALGDRFPLNGGTVRLGTVEQNRYAGPGESPPETICVGAHFRIGEAAPSRSSMAYRRSLAQHRRAAPSAHVDWDLTLGDSPPEQSGHALIREMSVSVTHERAVQGDLFDAAPAGAELRVAAVDTERDGARGRRRQVFHGTWRSGAQERSLTDVLMFGGLPQRAWVLADRATVLYDLWRDVYLNAVRTRGAARDPHAVPQKASEERLLAAAVGDVTATLAEHADDMAADLDFEPVVRLALRDRFMRAERQVPDTNLLYSDEFAARVIEALQGEGVSVLVATPNELDDIAPPVSQVLDFLRHSVRYLGPLREDPRVVYQDSPEAGNGYVGAKGEFCAAVLQNSGTGYVRAPLPHQALGENRRVQLSRAVDAWARFLEIGDGVSTADQGRLGLELQVRQDNVRIPLDLTSVGTGVSQILPVLVMCLQAPVGSLLMIEQPELHLNPRVQQRLADFLLAVAASGRQLIVETHSEYLISRLRLRVAEDGTDTVRRTVGLLFAERSEGSTDYRQVATNEYGGLENWPANFFDQSAEEAQDILRAAVDKRRAQQSPAGEATS